MTLEDLDRPSWMRRGLSKRELLKIINEMPDDAIFVPSSLKNINVAVPRGQQYQVRWVIHFASGEYYEVKGRSEP
jgi:hypothetical protein